MPSPCSNEELDNESRRERSACAVEYSRKIEMPIRCKSLQALEQCRDDYEGPPDHKRPRPGDTEKQRDSEIANEVVELPAEVRTGCPFSRPEGSDHKQDYDGSAASFCDSTKTMSYIDARGNSPQREVIVLVAMRRQNRPLERCAGVQGHAASPTAILLGYSLKSCGGRIVQFGHTPRKSEGN